MVSDQAPPTPLASAVGVRVIIVYKMVRGTVSLLLALLLGATALSGGAEHLRSFALALREHMISAWSIRLADLLVRASTRRHLAIASAALAADAALTLFEGWALRRGHAWGPWVVLIATASLLPLEVYEIWLHVRIGRVLILIINVAVVVYLGRAEARGRKLVGRSP